MPNRPIIDITTYKSLVELSDKSGHDLLDQLLKIFSEDASEAFLKLKSAIDSERYSEISKISHKFKSSAAEIGATRLRDLAAKLETSASSMSPQQISAVISEMEIEFTLALQELQRLQTDGAVTETGGARGSKLLS